MEMLPLLWSATTAVLPSAENAKPVGSLPKVDGQTTSDLDQLADFSAR